MKVDCEVKRKTIVRTEHRPLPDATTRVCTIVPNLVDSDQLSSDLAILAARYSSGEHIIILSHRPS